MADGHMIRCSTSPVSREMQTRTMVSYLLSPVGEAVLRRTKKSKCR